MRAALLILMVALPCLAQESTNVVMLGGINYTNPTIRPLDENFGIISSGTIATKINLADLPEPYRSRYYSEVLAQRARKAQEDAKAAEAEAIKKREQVRAAARARKAAEEAASSTTTMNVGVKWNSDNLLIMNKGTPAVAGKTITVYLNGSPPFTYRAYCRAPKVGDVVAIPLNSFIKKDGLRFNPVSHAVTEVWVGGAGYDYEGYR